MTAERFRQIRNIFDAALERESSERTAFVAEACHGDDDLKQEVEQLLLARDQDAGWLDAEATRVTGRLEGRRIGSYEILRTLGEGGMGTVYLAARADGAFRKLVALKIVRPESQSEEALRRFQREREILASLEHPNIARILDAGETADGLSYLVMEYVEGQPLDVYSDDHQLNVNKRLALFQQVCFAVRYAHSKQVIHRDLKPSNVLVTAGGEVKLLDFGIAKLLASSEDLTLLRTHSGLRLMTPEYASPEQVRGEAVGASTDIYSLGVLLYELLTGRRPYRLQSRILHEVVRIICEEPPTRPSTAVTQPPDREEARDNSPEALSRMRGVSPKDLRRELSGNLDGILLKSLEKDPLQRYRSVEELSEELQNHLRGESVRARRNATLDAARSLAQRHPFWIMTAIALALASWNGWIPETAIAIGSVTLVSLVLGFWMMRREFGAGFATKPVLERGAKNMAVSVLALLVLASFSIRIWHLDYIGALGISLIIPSAWSLYMALRWPFRSRFLGLTLLDASRRPNKLLLSIVVLPAALRLLSIFVFNLDPHLEPFVQLHIANRPRETFWSGYGDTSVPLTVYAAMSRHEVFWDLVAFAPLSQVPGYFPGLVPKAFWRKVPVRFGLRTEEAFGEEVSDNFFPALRVLPYLGRWFAPGDKRPHGSLSAAVVVLSYDLWKRTFNSDPSVIGQTMLVKGLPFTIICVASPGFTGIDPYHAIDFWIPLQDRPEFNPWGISPDKQHSPYGSPDWYCLLLLGKLQPGMTQQQALTRLTSDFDKTIFNAEDNQPKPRLYFSSASAADREAEKFGSPVVQALISTVLFVSLWLASCAEFRTQGLALAGMFIRWRRIAGYSWESKVGKFELLRFRLSGPWMWWPIPVRMLVKPDLRPQVDELLKQQLLEWPTVFHR